MVQQATNRVHLGPAHPHAAFTASASQTLAPVLQNIVLLVLNRGDAEIRMVVLCACTTRCTMCVASHPGRHGSPVIARGVLARSVLARLQRLRNGEQGFDRVARKPRCPRPRVGRRRLAATVLRKRVRAKPHQHARNASSAPHHSYMQRRAPLSGTAQVDGNAGYHDEEARTSRRCGQMQRRLPGRARARGHIRPGMEQVGQNALRVGAEDVH
jgi:hypothetical protein